MFDFDIVRLVAGLPGLLIALVVHEYAHARAAVAMGDPTPRMMGRLTLNPLSHVDPVGMLMLLIVQFGWAKPVMYNPRNFTDWRRGDIVVSLAGPAANLVTAFLALLVYGIMARFGVEITTGIYSVVSLIVIFNVNFAVFNMLPLPPLDGSKVLGALLPSDLAYKFYSIERYSFIILIALMMTPVLGGIIIPISRAILHLFNAIVSILI